MRTAPSRVQTRGQARTPASIPDDMPVGQWSPRRRRLTPDLEAVARDVDRIAEPLAAYLLVWLWSNRRSDPRSP